MAEVSFQRVSKRFGEVEAVRELTLDVADGELHGPRRAVGLGKTTALRMLAGLESVTAGEIRIGDRVVNRVAPRERDIAMVFQDYALYPQMRVYDNLAFGLRRRGTPKAQVEPAGRAARPTCSGSSRCWTGARASSRAASSSGSRSAARSCATRRCS